MALQILVDDREKHVIPHFKEHEPFTKNHNITYKVSRLTTSDYAIMYKDNILVLIERKTWKDLASSIKDGRSKNLSKLLEVRKETNCKVMYLIEGKPIPSKTAKYGRIPYKNLRAHLDHLMFRDNIHIVHTRTKQQTVERIYEMCKNYLSIKPSILPVSSSNSHKKGGAILKKKIEKSTESIIYEIWCCVPNITEKTACLFINKGHHVGDLLLGNISKEDIYSLKYDNGYIIGKRSEKIWKNSRINDANKNVFIKMLCCINGITKTTAGKILDKISFSDLISGKIEKKQISDIQKSEKRKVGNKVAGEIIKYFKIT